MERNTPSVGTAIGDDHRRRHALWVPSTFAGNPGRQPTLPIDVAHQLVDVDDLRLELDYQKGPCRRMPREDVDHSSFTVERKRNLRRDHPARQSGECASNRLMQRRVTRVQQPVEIASLPAQNEVEMRTEGVCDARGFAKLQFSHLSSLHSRDGRPGDVCLGSEIFLPPAFPDAQHPNSRTKSNRIHVSRTMRSRASLALIYSGSSSGSGIGSRGAPPDAAARRNPYHATSRHSPSLKPTRS